MDWRKTIACLFLACAGVSNSSCGRTLMGDSTSDAAVVASKDMAGTGDEVANRVCVDQAYGVGSGCSSKLPPPCKLCIACDPLLQGASSGCAAPDISKFDWPGGGVDRSLRYPESCVVYLPTGNPYYWGETLSCFCTSEFSTQGPVWACRL